MEGRPRQEYRDLWIIRLAGDGRCDWFEEWPYWSQWPRAARDNLVHYRAQLCHLNDPSRAR